MSQFKQPTVLLAATGGGTHIQVGPVREYADAAAQFDALDSALFGWRRDKDDRLCGGGPRDRMHAIKGEPVKFYRLRDVRPSAIVGTATNIEAEFGRVERVRSNGVRRTGFVGLR